MIDIIDRDTFRVHFNDMHPGLGDDDSQLWAPEHFEPNARPSRWFVYVQTSNWNPGEYWAWVRDHCAGSVLCYSSSDQGDWWGFERREDILLWSLRWAA